MIQCHSMIRSGWPIRERCTEGRGAVEQHAAGLERGQRRRRSPERRGECVPSAWRLREQLGRWGARRRAGEWRLPSRSHARAQDHGADARVRLGKKTVLFSHLHIYKIIKPHA